MKNYNWIINVGESIQVSGYYKDWFVKNLCNTCIYNVLNLTNDEP